MKLTQMPSYLIMTLSAAAFLVLFAENTAVSAFAPVAFAAKPAALETGSFTSVCGKVTTSSIICLSVSNHGFEDDFPKRKTKRELEREALMNDLKDINEKFWDYTVNFFYVAISSLILLNISGFAYNFTPEGLDVVPIKQYREERQWREELERQERTAPPPRPASIMQQAPAAFLLQQQQK